MTTKDAPPALEPGIFLDEKEAAAILRVAVATLRNWRSLGQGPRWRKIGARCVRYHRDDLAAFVAGDSSKAA